jgi:isochorismate synthase EntC
VSRGRPLAAGSDPQAELDETEAKIGAIRRALIG